MNKAKFILVNAKTRVFMQSWVDPAAELVETQSLDRALRADLLQAYEKLNWCAMYKPDVWIMMMAPESAYEATVEKVLLKVAEIIETYQVTYKGAYGTTSLTAEELKDELTDPSKYDLTAQ